MLQIVSNCNNSAMLRKKFLLFSRWLSITECSPMHWKTLRFCERNVRETRFKFCHFFPVQNRVKIISYMDRRHQGDLKNGIFHTLKTNRSGKTLTFWSAKWHFFSFSQISLNIETGVYTFWLQGFKDLKMQYRIRINTKRSFPAVRCVY